METFFSQNKKVILIVIAALLIIGAGVGAYFYFKGESAAPVTTTQAVENATNAAEKITESATQGTLPAIETNPLENKPDINPADKANPYKDVKTNPFE